MKELLLKNNRQQSLKIPRIIHQVYEDPAGPPDHLIQVSETWKACHPDWEYRFWDKQAIEEFMQAEFPEYIPAYNAFPFPVLRWDAIRCFILYHYGGLYADMDYECFEPMDSLLGDSTCCLGMEPDDNAILHNRDMIIGNALMASVPGHDFFKVIIDEMFTDKNGLIDVRYKGLYVMEGTGPFMFTRIYKNYREKETVTLLPAELVAPLTVDETRKIILGNATKDIEDKVEKAFALHYFLGSWFEQLAD
ncbi:hypothetical protein AGMMS50239_04050 [Bacteroidia bacterium]|nr:hypothetical protein AGMMS50239_04050 [Bacteroidia bacterium]